MLSSRQTSERIKLVCQEGSLFLFYAIGVGFCKTLFFLQAENTR